MQSKCKDELISDILQWIPTYGCTIFGPPAKNLHSLDTGCLLEDLPRLKTNRRRDGDKDSMESMLLAYFDEGVSLWCNG